MLADIGAQPAHPLHRRGEVDLRFARERNAELGTAARLVRRARRANDAFRRHAADVQAIAAHEIALDERDLRAQTGGARGAHQTRGAAADDDQIVFSRRRRIDPARRMTVFDQLLVVRIVREASSSRTKSARVGIETGIPGSGAAFLGLLRFAQRLARDARDDHDHGDSCRQADILLGPADKNPAAALWPAGKRVARRRADVHEEECRRQHADQIGQNVSAGAHRRQAEKIVKQTNGNTGLSRVSRTILKPWRADRLVERAKLRIRRRPRRDLFAQESARQKERTERAEIGAHDHDEKAGLQTEERSGADA